ncbi:Hypothetical_protein [Hexamita inflata]|uniref:Hypothetical_protein n=1 Tax=Hexamita inflata TaxID=28002 RepID=A0AA86NR42_9EUKA|nr:Hypothetical protein HINF_LOCUS11516 [Hexamita inflata]CAI9923881.1 Hypothetical protein HINF_LOCUS11526 [Hexamita inflata]
MAKKQGKIEKSLDLPRASRSQQGGLSCLEHLEALAGLTLLTEFSLVLLHRSLSAALLRSLSLLFSLLYFPQRNSQPTLDLRPHSSNPGRKSELLPLWKHVLSKITKKQGKSGFRLELTQTSRCWQGSFAAWSSLKQALSSLCLLSSLSFAFFALVLLPCPFSAFNFLQQFQLLHFPQQESKPTLDSRFWT